MQRAKRNDPILLSSVFLWSPLPLCPLIPSYRKKPLPYIMIGFRMFSAPFFENASNGLLKYLFQDDTAPVDAPFYDPFQANYLNSDTYDTDAFNDLSSVSTQRTGDIPPGQCILRFK